MNTVEQRTQALLAQLSVKAKVRQLMQLNIGDLPLDGDTIPDQSLQEALQCQSIGAICISPRDSYQDSKKKIESIQTYLKEKTPSGIPALAIAETLHGVLTPGATIFPQALAMGSTWNPGMVRKIGEAIGKEASSFLINQALAPVLDLGRDPRFGRIEE